MRAFFINNRSSVLILALLALFIPVFVIEYKVLNFTGGVFVYPLDDTYIHMSIAKNLAVNNTWGITGQQFASASSSILYTLLLGSLSKISVSTLTPFIINVIAGIILIIVIQKRLEKENIGFAGQVIILLLVIFFTPLHALIISGMEHTLQCLFSLLFIFGFCDWLSQTAGNNRTRLPWHIYILAFLVSVIRYEGLFLVAIVCSMLLFYKRFFAIISLSVISLLPIMVFGIYSVANGSYFLPNSVLLKSTPLHFSVSGISTFISTILIDKLTFALKGITALATQRLLLILPFTYLFFRKQINHDSPYRSVIFILTVCTVLQLSFASTGWFYRYEAYLILCSTVTISILFYKYYKQRLVDMGKKISPVVLFIAFVLLLPLVLRSTAAYAKAGQACINIYEQQYQMGNFLKKHFYNDTIAVNDIGAVSYFNKGRIIDLGGLADIQVARSRQNNYNTPDFLNNLVKQDHVKLAIVYDSWFDTLLLHKWQKIATWQIQNNVICGDDTVTFYAIEDSVAPLLKTYLLEYQKSLPGDVRVHYY